MDTYFVLFEKINYRYLHKYNKLGNISSLLFQSYPSDREDARSW